MWLRWTITKLKGSTNICQMAELYLYDKDGNKLNWISGTTVNAPSQASYSSSESPEKIIDGNVNTKFCLLNFNIYTTGGMSILIEIPETIEFTSYSYVTANDAQERDPISWKLELSYDNTTWFNLSEVSDASITNTRRTETQKWNIKVPYNIKYLIQSDNTLYTIENNELKVLEVTELTSDTFKTYGSDTAPTFDILNVFTNPKIYCWTDDTQPHALTASVKATPPKQTIITNDIDISNPSITGIEKVTAEYTGDPHVACSFDNGITWKLYNGVAWVVLSEAETGMTMETLLAITTESWTEVIEGLNSFKMRFTLATTDDTVTNIVINFTN